MCVLYAENTMMNVCLCTGCKGQGDGKYLPLNFEVGSFALKFTNAVHTGDFALSGKGNWKLDSKKGKIKRRKIHYTYLS